MVHFYWTTCSKGSKSSCEFTQNLQQDIDLSSGNWEIALSSIQFNKPIQKHCVIGVSATSALGRIYGSCTHAFVHIGHVNEGQLEIIPNNLQYSPVVPKFIRQISIKIVKFIILLSSLFWVLNISF